jgi:hypothetical protein
MSYGKMGANLHEPDAERDDYDDEDFDDEEEEFDCGAIRDARTHKLVGCGKAGSEECDFECPYHNEMYAEMARQERLPRPKKGMRKR